MKNILKLVLCLFFLMQLDSAWAVSSTIIEKHDAQVTGHSCGYELYIRRMPSGAANHVKLAWLLEELLGKNVHDVNRAAIHHTLLAWTAHYEFAEYVQRMAKELGCEIEIKESAQRPF